MERKFITSMLTAGALVIAGCSGSTGSTGSTGSSTSTALNGTGAASSVLTTAATAPTTTGTTGTGASSSPDTTGNPVAGKPRDLTVTVFAPPVSFDPKDGIGGPFAWYYQPAYASLINDDGKGNLVPGLATTWGYVGTGNTKFELTLRDNAKFSDGTPVTAQDVADSFAHFQTGFGPDVVLYLGWKLTATDATHLTLDLPTPNPMVPTLLSTNSLASYAVSKAGLTDPAKLAQDTFGAGPYQLDESATRPGELYVYTPNPYYWDQSAIKWTSIRVQAITNQASQLKALQSGQVEAMSAVPTLAKNVPSGIAIAHGPYTWNGLQIFDMDGKAVPALGQLKVRQAMNYALNRTPIVKAVWGDYGRASAAYSSPADPVATGAATDLDNAYPYDVAKAKALMAEAGYPGGFSLDVAVQQGSADQSTIGQILVDQLGAVGIKISLKEMSQADWVQALLTGKLAATVIEGSPYFFMQVQRQYVPGPLNVFQNTYPPSIRAPYDAFMTAPADQLRAKAVEVNRALVEYATAVSIGQYESITLYNKGIGGVAYVNSPLVTPITTWYPTK